jgi:hydroxymethylbilane synthase
VDQELRLGTRGSQLALWQANTVASRIAAAGGPPCRIVIIRTTGDRLHDAPLSEVGGKRLFVKEIEDALLRDEIDLAVHSSKDMPAVLPDDLAIGAVLPREDPADAVVLPARADRAEATATIEDLVAQLGRSPSIGTGSVRRIAQLTRLFPGATFQPIRGNLDTRLRKLDEGAHHALVLAAAGLRRLGFAARISFALPVEVCVPAPGQGIVAVEVRAADTPMQRLLDTISDEGSAAALTAERALVQALGGGCQTPVGALASPAGGETLSLTAVVVALDGSRAVRGQARGPRAEAADLGTRLGAQLIADGANEILADARRAHGAVEGIQP